jgi:hypothetical protein
MLPLNDKLTLPIDLTVMRLAASRHTRIAEVNQDFGYPGKR